MRFHPGEVALDGGAAGTGQSFGHRGGDEWPFGQNSAQGARGLSRERGHLGFRPRIPCLDIVEVAHCGQTCRLHPLKPARQTVSGWAAGAQPPCPAHGQPSALTQKLRYYADPKFKGLFVPQDQ